MKRIITIIITLFIAVTCWGQRAEMFHADSSFLVPGIGQQQLFERATSWFVFAGNSFDSVFDYDSSPWGQSREFIFRDVQAGSRYRNLKIQFRITVRTDDQGYIVSMDRLFITCYRGRRTIFCVEQIPVVSEGYFPNDRLLKDRLYISEFSRKYAVERFHELIPSIRGTMENYSIEFHWVQ